jgi:hypothetical protein
MTESDFALSSDQTGVSADPGRNAALPGSAVSVRSRRVAGAAVAGRLGLAIAPPMAARMVRRGSGKVRWVLVDPDHFRPAKSSAAIDPVASRHGHIFAAGRDRHGISPPPA